MNIADFLLGSIPLLLQFYAEMYRETDYKNTIFELESEFSVPKTKFYDFIVVGGGSAGCVLAGRLSEHFTVLLLEAGGTPPPGTSIPYFTSAIGQDASINYFFDSIPQSNARLCCDGIAKSKTGKMLGGSGSHNDMIHSRGNPQDYDNWADLLNDDSFSYSNVLKYFRKMENFVGEKFGAESDEFYGKDGPIMVNSNDDAPILDLWFDAGNELGYPVGDPNGFQRESFAPLNLAVRNGQRSSSYIEYIRGHEGSRKNLTVIRYANVSEILLDDDKRAYGVMYKRHGIPQLARATKEIILSAGTYSSPLLLMKSGIGPVDVLNAAEIPVKVPLEAIGKNLVEHPLFVLPGFAVNDSSIFLQVDSSQIDRISEQFHNDGDGVLTKNTEVQCFITSSKARPGWPDIWIAIHALPSVNGSEILNFYTFLGRPQSKGSVTLDAVKYRSGVRDDQQLASIDYRFLTDVDDVDALLDAVKFIFKIVDTEAFRSVNLTYIAQPDPACQAFTFLSDDYWKCKLHQDVLASVHMVGTCSMGPDAGDSTTSVVDTQFRVRGVSNLRVVDASVMPEVTNANINAPVMMLAEKAADDIVSFYQHVSEETDSLYWQRNRFSPKIVGPYTKFQS